MPISVADAQAVGSNSFVVLGVITSSHGVRGSVKIKPFTQYPDDLLAYGTLRDAAGKAYPMKIIGESAGLLLAAIEGITDRNMADKLRGIELGVDRSALPPTDDGEYYYNDLEGLTVFTRNGVAYGQLKSVHNYGAGDIAEILLPDGNTELFPFNDAIFPVVDVAAKRIEIVLPEMVRAMTPE